LEDWWRFDLDLKLFSRELNQRTPTHLGTASFGKYLQATFLFTCHPGLLLWESKSSSYP
jgi:hypothetical protein